MEKTIISASLALTMAIPAMGATDLTTLLNELSPQLRSRVEVMINLGIDTPAAVEMIQNMIQNRINTRTALKMVNEIIAAKRMGLPVGPMIEKADEGFAKMVPAQRIAMAMKQVEDRYSYAYSKVKALNLDKKTATQLAANIAHALAAGMSKEEMNRVMEQLQTRIQTMNSQELPNLPLKQQRQWQHSQCTVLTLT